MKTFKELLAEARKAISDGDMERAAELKAQVEMMRDIDALEPVKAVDKVVANPIVTEQPDDAVKAMPNVNTKTKLGDDYIKSMAYFARTGDASAIRDSSALKASTDDITSIAVDANAGDAVPVGHYQNIITKMRESGLRAPLGLMNIPGVGTTVNVPIDIAGDGKWVTTGEQVADHTVSFDRDTPQIDKIAMTLVSKTKKVELTNEILRDEDSRLVEFIERYVGAGLAATWNEEIVTKALANGTAALTLDSATTIGAAEIPELVYLLPDGYEGNSSWIMRRSTEGVIRGMTGEQFLHAQTPQGEIRGNMPLWGSPVYNSAEVPAIASAAKTMLFGDFSYMGYREDPGMTMLRDPYSVDGAIVLKYYTGMVAEVMIAEAIIYATQLT